MSAWRLLARCLLISTASRSNVSTSECSCRVPTGLSERRLIRPADLDGERLVVAPEGSPHRLMLTQALATAGVEWSVAVETTGWELMIQFARYGLGIAVVNDFCPTPRGFRALPLAGVPSIFRGSSKVCAWGRVERAPEDYT